MTLYHGSNIDFNAVDLSESKDRRDFGKGFYTTTIREQALQWGYNMFNRFGGDGIFIYEFDFLPQDDLSSKYFPEISDEWFDFILSNRTIGGLQHGFDFVQGPVANDKTVLTITGFIDGLYTREEAMRRLRYSKTNDEDTPSTSCEVSSLERKFIILAGAIPPPSKQVSLHTERAVSLLKLLEKRKTHFDKIMYNGQNLTFLVTQKIEHIVSIIAEKENKSFDRAYVSFSTSRIYESLQNPSSLLWAENAEFIVDEYYRGH